MLKHQLYINLFAITSTLALTACADEVASVLTPDTPTPAEGKTPIDLTVGGVLSAEGTTRAVVTDGTTNTKFGRDTKVFLLMQSDKDTETHDGYEYKGTRANQLYSPCRATVYNSSNPTALVFENGNQKYWDDAHARSTQLTIWAFAQRIANDTDRNWPDYSFQSYSGDKPSMESTAKKDYKSTESYDFQSTTPLYPAIFSWSVYNVNPVQDANTLIYQDLLFSNNIADYRENQNVPEESRKDNRLKFDFSTHKFPASTELKFYHAMSKITIKIKAGVGFKADGTDFILSNNKSVDELNDFNTQGLFNIKDGEFQKIHNSIKITKIPLVSESSGTSDPNYVLEALAIPNINEFMISKRTDVHQDLKDEGSRFDEDGDNVMIQFTIDGNTYKIKSGALFKALKDLEEGDGANQIHKRTDNSKYYIPMEAGKNYVFTFTIGKTKIENISATLAPWVNVVAVDQVPDNGYVKLELKDQTGNLETGNPKFDFYLAKDPTTFSGNDYNTWAQYNWDTGYTKENVTWNAISKYYETPVFWPDNSTFYHFRTINRGLSVTKTSPDHVTMYSGKINDTVDTGSPTSDYSYTFSDGSNNGYNDYIWGAPFKRSTDDNHPLDATTVEPTYSPETGYCNASPNEDGQIYKAIGATKETIFFYQFHMMSNIFVDLDNTNENVAQTDLVDLTGAEVKIFRYAKSAKLQMGNALVTGHDYTGTDAGIAMISDVKAAETSGDNQHPAYDYSYRMVPQPLKYTPTGGSETTVGIEITCTDGNVYKIPDISTITTTGQVGTAIDYWMPGKNYYYKFTLKKSGIDKIQATVVDWVNVTAADETVTIQ